MPDALLEQPPRFPVTLEEYMPPELQLEHSEGDKEEKFFFGSMSDHYSHPGLIFG